MDLQRAIEIAVDAHKTDIDKGGNPYILHPLRLMMQMDTEDEKIVAVLHDVVEDHGEQWSMEKIKAEGFPTSVIRGLESVTKMPEEESDASDDVYFSFVRRAAADPIGRKVKFADIKDNLDITRLGREITEKDVARIRKYKKALDILIEKDLENIRIN